VLVPEYSLDPRARWGWAAPPPARLARILADAEPDCEGTIGAVLELTEWCGSVPRHPGPGAAREPHWDNDFWGGLDAAVQVAELRRRDPALYLEVGSGHSTRFARRAIRDFGLRSKIVSIDPHPRAEIDDLCDEVIRTGAQDADREVFARLTAGDVLFIDGSHTAVMNSDATVLMLEILPELPPGVLVQIDDVFLPWDYPPTWARRWYGEQYLVAAQLLGGATGWRITFPGWHLTRLSPSAERFAPLWPHIETRFGRHASSFWFETTATDPMIPAR